MVRKCSWHKIGINRSMGVYRTEADANAAIKRLRNKPGFAEFADGFQIDAYELNQDHWTEGFLTN